MAGDKPTLILASASPRRTELLAAAGIVPDQTIPAEIDETPQKAEAPEAYVSRMAEEKARAVAAKHASKVVLAADTIVVCGRSILLKAADEAEARKLLKKLSGRRHRVMTAVAVINAQGKLAIRRVETRVAFRPLEEAEIARYLASGEWQDKAGAYAIQGGAAAFIPWINGSHSNVIGLPVSETLHLLQQAGVTP